jgi:hypothetical protein
MSTGLASRKPRRSNALLLPPFGNVMLDAIRRGEKPNIFVVAGSDAWATHQIRRERIVLPPGADPAGFDWSFMRGLQPTIVGADADHATLRKLAWVLLKAGCPLVALAYEDLVASATRTAADPIKYYDRGNVIRVMFFRND